MSSSYRLLRSFTARKPGSLSDGSPLFGSRVTSSLATLASLTSRASRASLISLASLASLASVASLSTGCSDKQATAIVIAVSSEARMPKEVDKLRITVRRNGDDRFLQIYEFDHETHPLPGTLTVASDPDKDPDGTLLIRVEATRGDAGAPWKMVRESVLGFSKEKTKLLRMPLRYACWGADPCTEPGESCRAGECKPSNVDIDALEEFVSNADLIVSAPSNELSAKCFNPSFCLGLDKLVPVAVDENCSFDLGADLAPETLNLSMTWLEISPDNPVVVEPGDATEGYTEKNGHVTLAPGLCKAIHDGKASLGASSACPAKLPNEPICYVQSSTGPACTPTVKINEVNGGDGLQAPYIELYNTSDCIANLDGYSLRYADPATSSSTEPVEIWRGSPGDVVPKKSWFVVTLPANSIAMSAGLDMFAPKANDEVSTMTLEPTDTVVWGVFTSPPLGFGESSAATALMTGLSIGRVPDGADSGDNGKDFALVPPTPGASNGGGSTSKDEYLFVMTGYYFMSTDTAKTVWATLDPAGDSWPQEPADLTGITLTSPPSLASITRDDGTTGALLVGLTSQGTSTPVWSTWDNGSFSAPTVLASQAAVQDTSVSLLSLGPTVLYTAFNGSITNAAVFTGADFSSAQSPPEGGLFVQGLGMAQAPSGNVVASGVDPAPSLYVGTFEPTNFMNVMFKTAGIGAVGVSAQTRPVVLVDSAGVPTVFYVNDDTEVTAYRKDGTSPTGLGIFGGKGLAALAMADGSYLVAVTASLDTSGMSSLSMTRGKLDTNGSFTVTSGVSYAVNVDIQQKISAPVLVPGNGAEIDAELFVVNGGLKRFQITQANTITTKSVPDTMGKNTGLSSLAVAKVHVSQ